MTRTDAAKLLRRLAGHIASGDAAEGGIQCHLTATPGELDVDAWVRPGNLESHDIDAALPEVHRIAWQVAVMAMAPRHRAAELRQMLVDAMSAVEQSDEEDAMRAALDAFDAARKGSHG